MTTRQRWGSDTSAQQTCAQRPSFAAATSLDLDANPRRQKHLDRTLSVLNAAIKVVDLAKELSSTAVLGSVSILLTTIRSVLSPSMIYSRLTCEQDSTANKTDYVELGLACADVRKSLDRGMDGRRPEHLS